VPLLYSLFHDAKTKVGELKRRLAHTSGEPVHDHGKGV